MDSHAIGEAEGYLIRNVCIVVVILLVAAFLVGRCTATQAPQKEQAHG